MSSGKTTAMPNPMAIFLATLFHPHWNRGVHEASHQLIFPKGPIFLPKNHGAKRQSFKNFGPQK
jgi:hypothetical protein